MINFSSLLDNLLLNSSKKKKIEILVRYFQSEPLINKKWALSILDNSFSSNLIKANDIKKMIMNKVEDDMFLYSYDYVGDLAETFSLLWPKNKIKKKTIPLNLFMKNLSECEDKEELIKLLETYFNHSTSDEIYTMIKILTGGLRVGVSSQLLKESLSKIGVKSKSEIEEKWFGFKFPYTGFF
jgi:DNA ligase-1